MTAKNTKSESIQFLLLLTVWAAIGVFLIYPFLDSIWYRLSSHESTGKIVSYSVEESVHSHSGGPRSGSRLWVSLNPNAKVSFTDRTGTQQQCIVGYEVNLTGKRYNGDVRALEKDLSALSAGNVTVYYNPSYAECRTYLGVGERPWRVWFGVLWLLIVSVQVFLFIRERKSIALGANHSLKADVPDGPRP